ncbi:MAG: DNA-processing protein DprA [Ruminococcus sp.]|nr:DNA-processing protein DprA [Candidatus Copronaster equi]
MTDKLYWLWAQTALGIGQGVRTDEIVSYFSTAKNLYFAGEMEWKLSGAFTLGQIEKLKKTKLDAAEKIAQQCMENGWKIITPDDADYPSMLFKLPNLPLVLYVDGKLDCLKNRITIAVVGSRKTSRNSACIARALSSSMARSGAVIVSGGALGIDSAAHLGALDEKSPTVAVLGCGFNCNYLSENQAMRNDISKVGAVITEYPPDAGALSYHFPFRNRLISGLSYGTAVIEAGAKSGSLITARLALEQGRDVFAVPGDITSSFHIGANRLIRDGAKPVFNAMDVLEEYAMRFPEMMNIDKVENELKMKTYSDPPTSVPLNDNPERKEKGEVKFVKFPEPPLLSENAGKIYRAFEKSTMQAEELIIKTGLDTVDFMSAMTELEILDLVVPGAGKIYTIKQK